MKLISSRPSTALVAQFFDMVSARSKIAIFVLVVNAAITAPGAAASAGPLSPSYVRVGTAPVVPAGSERVSPLASSAVIHIDIALQPRDPAALANYAQEVSTPGSSLYRRYLPKGQFASIFGPTQASIDSVREALVAEGLDPGTISPNDLVIPVTATARILAKAFSTGFEHYRLPSGRVTYANTSAPSVPATIASEVQGIVGLDDLYPPTPDIVLGSGSDDATSDNPRPAIVTGGPQPCSVAANLAAVQGTHTADEIAYSYGFSNLYGEGDLGSGETVAVMEWEGPDPSDIATYESCYGIDTPVSYVKVDGHDGGLAEGPNSGETDLDIEDIAGLAPDVGIIDYEASPNAATGWLDNWTEAISQDAAQVISVSWGICEPLDSAMDPTTQNTLFEEAATQGQTILAAAGDSGSQGCLPSPPFVLAVDNPASDPYVTGVGGTSLLSSISVPPVETVWNGHASRDAGGGGISSQWAMPPYQADASPSVGVINAYSSGTPCGAPAGDYCREVPDVSADGDWDTGYVIAWNGFWIGAGGTSGAAPTWAALIALTNASSACDGETIGFANPVLYDVAATQPEAFNDITVGNNDGLGDEGGLYPALPGYDMASGLGTPNGAVLPAALCSGDPVSVTNPGPQSADVGQLTSIQIDVTDSTPGQTLTYSARGLPPGLAIGSSTGLISGEPTTPGVFTVVVTAEDGNEAIGSATFDISVPPSVSGLKPAYGPSSGSTKPVEITGLGFKGATEVLFGASPASFTVSKNGKTITANSPGGIGTVNVAVVGPSGTSPSSSATVFDYGPTITQLSPDHGGSGTKVVVVGTNLSGASFVLFGALSATSFTVKSTTKIVAYVPVQSVGQVTVTVTTPGGTSPSTSADLFTYS